MKVDEKMNPFEEVLLKAGYTVWSLNGGIIQVPAFDAVRWWDWNMEPPCFDADIFGDPVPTSLIIFPDGRLHLIDSSHEEYAMLFPELKIKEADALPGIIEKLDHAFGDEEISTDAATEVGRNLLFKLKPFCILKLGLPEAINEQIVKQVRWFTRRDG